MQDNLSLLGQGFQGFEGRSHHLHRLFTAVSKSTADADLCTLLLIPLNSPELAAHKRCQGEANEKAGDDEANTVCTQTNDKRPREGVMWVSMGAVFC